MSGDEVRGRKPSERTADLSAIKRRVQGEGYAAERRRVAEDSIQRLGIQPETPRFSEVLPAETLSIERGGMLTDLGDAPFRSAELNLAIIANLSELMAELEGKVSKTSPTIDFNDPGSIANRASRMTSSFRNSVYPLRISMDGELLNGASGQTVKAVCERRAIPYGRVIELLEVLAESLMVTEKVIESCFGIAPVSETLRYKMESLVRDMFDRSGNARPLNVAEIARCLEGEWKISHDQVATLNFHEVSLVDKFSMVAEILFRSGDRERFFVVES